MSKTVIINPLTLRENDIYSFFIFRYHPGNENEGKWLLITLTNAKTPTPRTVRRMPFWIVRL